MALSEPNPAGAAGASVASVDAVRAWIDKISAPLDAEDLPLAEAEGRVLAAECRAGSPIPDRDRSALDGFAVKASESIGAAAYDPLSLQEIAVAIGDPLPAGVDAVVPLGLAELDSFGGVVLVEPIVPGANIRPQGVVARAGAILVPRSARLAGHHLGLLAMADIAEVAVFRSPRILILLAGAPQVQGMRDCNGTMVRAAVQRDGGLVDQILDLGRQRGLLASEIGATDADIVLIIGGTGPADDDHAVAALSDAGEIAFHGVALRPGDTAAFGQTAAGAPVIALPGEPAACLWSYEMFAGRAIRRRAGRRPNLPFQRRAMVLTRKIVSTIGFTEICPVRFGASADMVEALPSFAEIGLMAAVGGDGFVIVPEASEGYPAGTPVMVHLYEGDWRETGTPQ